MLSTDELNQKGVVIAMEMGNVQHTIGSQFLITLSANNTLGDSISDEMGGGGAANGGTNANNPRYVSLGTITEDFQNVLSKLNRAYCDDDGRPFADIRIQRALVIHDPYEDPAGMDELLAWRGVVAGQDGEGDEVKDGYPLAPQSPLYKSPPEEVVPVRIQADDTTLFATAGWDDNGPREYEDEDEEDEEAKQKRLELQQKQEEEWRKKQDNSRAVMLEMLGDLPTADIQAPENVLFVCKLNPFTTSDDLELIFSRFDSEAKADIIRDPDTGASLQYAFVEFRTAEASNEAYLKMNNALVDDRRIKVDFSQSVSHVWDRYNKRYRKGDRSGMDRSYMDGGGRGGRGGRGRGRGQGGGRGRGRGPSFRGGRNIDNELNYRHRGHRQESSYNEVDEHEPEFDSFGRARARDMNKTRRKSHSRSPSRDVPREERRRKRSRSGSRGRRHKSHRSNSRSDSSDDTRRRRKHRKHRHKDHSRRRRSRSRDRDQDREKRKKHHRHGEYSDDNDRRNRKHSHHHRRHHRSSDKHHRER